MSRPAKIKIDWDSVELLTEVVEDDAGNSERMARPDGTAYSDRRGRSNVKKILSGAARQARAEGVPHTHVQLRHLITSETDILVYGWELVAAAVESHQSLSRGIAFAVRAMRAASAGVNVVQRGNTAKEDTDA